MNYSLGLDRLKLRIPQNSADHLSFLSYEARLLGCLDDEQVIGTTEIARVERAGYSRN